MPKDVNQASLVLTPYFVHPTTPSKVYGLAALAPLGDREDYRPTESKSAFSQDPICTLKFEKH